MSPGILGKKIGMTQLFRPDGQVVPVTLLKAGPCMVVQRKTPTSDGYDAVQLGLVEFVKPQRINKPATGHLKKAGVEGAKFLREFPLRPGDDDLKPGDQVLVDQFKPKDKVDVIGISKGRGLRRCGQAAPFPRRRRYPRIDVPSRSRFDRRVQLPVSRAARYAHGRTHGQRSRHGAQSRNHRGGHRGQRPGGQRRRPRTQRRVRGGAEGQEVTPMPTVDIVDLNNQKVGELELADEVFGAPVNEALLYEAVRQYQAGLRSGTHKTKVRSRSSRLRQEALEAEGHRPRALGIDSLPAVASRRHGARPGTARLQLQAAAQDGPGRPAFGAFRQGSRRRTEGDPGLQFHRSQDQDCDELAGQCGHRADRPSGGQR